MKLRLLLAPARLCCASLRPTKRKHGGFSDNDQVTKKFDEAFNNGDAAAVAALYTEDAVQVTPQGPVFGRQAIEKLFAGRLKIARAASISRFLRLLPRIP
jgi:hypothetical protein